MSHDYATAALPDDRTADDHGGGDHDYTKELRIVAAPGTVLSALTTLEGCTAWWAPAAGSAAAGGQLRFTFTNPDTPLVLRVREAQADRVAWHVEACEFLPDWVGTTIVFGLAPSGDGGCELRFRHSGLNANLECYGECQAGWEHFLPILRDYAETGTPRP